jgi:hypothetical protein
MSHFVPHRKKLLTPLRISILLCLLLLLYILFEHYVHFSLQERLLFVCIIGLSAISLFFSQVGYNLTEGLAQLAKNLRRNVESLAILLFYLFVLAPYSLFFRIFSRDPFFFRSSSGWFDSSFSADKDKNIPGNYKTMFLGDLLSFFNAPERYWLMVLLGAGIILLITLFLIRPS